MAGKPGYKHLYDLTVKELDDARMEITRLKTLIMRHDPDLLKDSRPKPLTKYDAKVPDRVLKMADMGMTEEQWVSTFGITMRTWSEWKAQFPELMDAIEKANVRALAWWDEKAREAQEKGNNRFPILVYERRTAKLREAMDASNSRVADLGDASRLVLLDLRTEGPLAGEGDELDEEEDEE